MIRTKPKSKLNKTAIITALVALLFSVGIERGFAAEPVSMPDLRDEKGTLTIATKYVDEDKSKDINGLELTAYKVAELTVKGGDPRYHLTEDFKDLDINFDGMTAEQSIDAAGMLFKVIYDNKLEGIKAVSKDGYASFGEVDHGMYLVVQTGASSEAVNYTAIEPYLIMAPQPLVETGEIEEPAEASEPAWDYDVVSIPKMVLGIYEPPVPPEEDEVKEAYKEKTSVKGVATGDRNLILAWSIAIAVAACIIAFFVVKRMRDRKSE